MMHSDLSMPALPSNLPWEDGTYLLLDGVSVPELSSKLYQWYENPSFEPLYLGTEWNELCDLSPCLVRLSGQHDPVMQRFIENASEEWGYLIFSKVGFDGVLRHLRWLVCVEPPQGDPMLLRLADPAVAHQLLADGNVRLFGPIEQVCAADCIEGRWWQHMSKGEPQKLAYEKPYRLSDAELEALGEVSFRQVVLHLSEHMRTFFPEYKLNADSRERLAHMRDIAEQAYGQGMQSEREIFLYGNVFGYLRGEDLEKHPDIASLLSEKSTLTPAQRVERAAEIAQQRASQTEGNLV